MKNALSALLVLLFSACGGSPIPRPTEADATRGRDAYPGLTLSELSQGRTLYVSRCGSCHALKPPRELGAERWATEVGKMREENGVKLTDLEAQAIVRYLAVAASAN